MNKAIKLFLPPGSKRRIAAGRLKGHLRGRRHSIQTYESWIKHSEPKTLSPIMKHQETKISVVVPCFNTPERYIKELISSLIRQTYNNWELCIGDGSTNQTSASIINKLCDMDQRIKYVRIKTNLGISGNTNAALEVATGDYIAFLDHDDILPKWALNEVALAINHKPDAELFYSDEDRLSEDGKFRMTPLFKPDWSPDLFLCANYIAHFLVAKRSLMNKLSGLRPEYDGSQDYDLVLRALDYKPQIVHIPKVLYHMRLAASSTAKEITIKNYSHTSGQRAIADYLKRNKIKAKVLEMPDRPTNHRIKYELSGKPLVSIIIPFKDKVNLLQKCIDSIESKTSYKNYELILISNNSNEAATAKYLDKISQKKHIKLYHYDQSFNYSAVNNFGRTKASGKILVFLNNDTEVITPEWLEELASVAQRKKAGAVGALLFYPDGSIQHAGIIVGLLGTAGIIFRGLKLGSLTPFWLPDWPRNYLAVTGACLAVESTKFDKVGGFNEDFIVAGSDVTLGIDLYEAGYRNVYWPYAQLVHHESKSVGGEGSYSSAPKSDYDNSMIHYKPYLHWHDPYFNPNLDLLDEKVSLRSNYAD